MDNKTGSLFREQSLKKAEAPESADSMLHVIRPGAWVVLLAVLAALAGLLIWTVFGTVNARTETFFRADEYGKAVFYVYEDQAQSLSRGSDLTIDGTAGKITRVAKEAVLAGEVLDDYVMHKSGIGAGDWVVKVRTNITVEAGIHKAQLVIEEVEPVQLILGK